MDDNIARTEAAITAQVAVMAEIAERASAAVAEWLVERWQEEVRDAVRDHPETTKKLSASGELTQLKADVAELCERASEVAAARLDDPALWPHRFAEITDESHERQSFNSYGSGIPQGTEESLRRAIGEVGRLLVPAGLTENNDRWRLIGDDYRYPYAVTWPGSVRAVFKEYGLANGVLGGLERDLSRSRTEKTESEAEDLWDNA